MPHVQTREDKFFFLISGGPLQFTAGNQVMSLTPGGFINIRSGTALRSET